jgi:hypothetical protein
LALSTSLSIYLSTCTCMSVVLLAVVAGNS